MTTQAIHKVLIVESSAIIVEGLLALLSKHKQFQCLHPLSSAEALEEYVRREKPDLIVLNPTCLIDVKWLQNNQIPLVALLYQYVERDKLNRFQAILDIRESREQIPQVLLQVCEQKTQAEEGVDGESYELSDREIDVLKYVAQGLMNKEVADRLNISVHTVITHRKNISRKTGIKSVAGLTVYAIMKGYIASV